MPDKAWKQFERRVARDHLCERRGPGTADSRHQGQSDFTNGLHHGETKLLSRPGWADIVHAIEQVETAAAREGAGIPVAVLKRKRQLDDNAIVAFRYATYARIFLEPRALRALANHLESLEFVS